MSYKRHEEIIELIEGFIKNSRLKTGDRLPSERFLAERFHVSRNTVREAIKALSENNVVVSRRGAGTYVAEGAFNCLVDGLTRRYKRIQEIFELRKLLEPQIARLAAERIAEETIQKLDDIVSAQEAALESGIDNVELDERFHRLLVRASGNNVLADIYDTLHDILAESRVRELQSATRNRLSLKCHTDIVQALKNRAPEKAADLMREHMEQVEKNLEHPGLHN